MNNQASMNVTVVLHIGIGSFEQGFPVTAEIFENGCLVERKDDFASLPPVPNTPQLKQNLQAIYGEMGKTTRDWHHPPLDAATDSEESKNNSDRGIVIPPQTTNHSSTEECKLAASELANYLGAKPSGWFNHSSFQNLRDWILRQARVRQDQSVPVIFEFKTGQDEQNAILKRLPWHLWDLFTELQNAEVVLYGRVARSIQSLSQPVKILAIFGSGEGGLELKDDIEALQKLKSFGAKVESEQEPSREQLHNRLFNESWDILFFAGHSSSDKNLRSGHLLVGKGRQYSLDDIRVDLQRAVDKGLKMAIFNSCDGLGIADFLMNLKVPTVIVFREPVPDLVARIFLKKFLENFSRGKPLYRSVREARDGLHWLETAAPPYPCASWLPVIYQNPSQPELVWPPVVDPEPVNPWKRYVLAAIGLALLGSVGLGSVRYWYISQAGTDYGSSLKPDYSSLGAKSLIDGGTLAGTDNSREGCRSREKQAGIQAFATEKYSEAMTHFDSFLKSCRFDPEAQIYYNNAKALYDTASTLLSEQKKTLRVAVVVPIGSKDGLATGARADVAQEMLRGVAIAQYKINKEGAINGKPLLIQIVDDDKPGNQGLSERIPEVGSELKADPAILAVVGPNDSKATQSLGEAIGESELTVISPTSTAARDRKSPNDSGSMPLNPNILRTATTDAIAAKKLVEDMRREQKSKVTVIYDENHLYSKSLKEEFEKATQGQPKVSLCNLADRNTNSDGCLKPGNSDALLWIPSPEDLNRAIPFIKNNNNRPPVWAGDSAYGRSILTQLGTAAQGMKIFVPWAKENNPNSAPLEAFGINWFNEGINWRTGMAYDATQAIAQGLRLMGSAPKREGLRNILLSSGFKADGILGNGTVQFTRDGEANYRVGVGDRKPDNKLGVMVEVKCEQNCGYFKLN